jgi:hypothetical protein
MLSSAFAEIGCLSIMVQEQVLYYNQIVYSCDLGSEFAFIHVADIPSVVVPTPPFQERNWHDA